MIIYLVTVDSNGSPYNQLAFTTEKEAKKYVKKQNKKHNGDSFDYDEIEVFEKAW